MTRQRGFSLVEVLIALVILAIVITTTLAVFVERQRRLQLANETILAYQVLSNETEVRRRINFTSLDNADVAPPTFITDTTLLRPLRPFTTNVSVASTSTYVKSVTMTITWHGGDKRASLSIVRVDTGGTNLW